MKAKNKRSKKILITTGFQNGMGRLMVAIMLLSLSSCMTTPSHENAKDMKKVDQKSLSLLTRHVQAESQKISSEQKALRAGLEKTKTPVLPLDPVSPKFDPLDGVNVTVDTNNGDAQMVLQAIARQAHMNLMLSPELSQYKRTISMHLKNVPARVVFTQTLKQLDLYGKVEGNILIVRPLQERIFNLDFLQTTVAADFTAGGDVFGANNISGGGGGSTSGSGGSGSGSNILQGNFTITGSSGKNNDPYAQLAAMLKRIIGNSEDSAGSAKKGDAGKKQKSPFQPNTPVYSLNRMTGTLLVRGKPSQIHAVTRMINRYKAVLNRQILIEAQILDVSLNDNHQYGVDWSFLRRRVATSYTGAGGQQLGGINDTIPGATNPGRSVTLPAIATGALGRALGIAYAGNNFDVALNLLRQFGTVRVLSNPTLRVKNAIPALINVGTNTRFVSQSAVTINNLGGSATTTANVVTDSVFNGVMVGVAPFIDDNGKINLTIHPIETEVDQKSLALQDVGGGNRISLPKVDFKGMSTSLSLHDGDTVMLGGLIDENGTAGGDGIPWLSRLPGLGYLFGSRSYNTHSRELVIVLSVHLL